MMNMMFAVVVTTLILATTVRIGESVTDLNSVCDSVVPCLNSPCDCTNTEADSNCQNCNAGSGCSQCESGFFNQDLDSYCMACSLIENCKHCTNQIGCQQCIGNDCQRVENSCGIMVCDCSGGGSEPATDEPTDKPTQSPISDEAKIDAATEFAEDFLLGEDCNSFLDEFNSETGVVCMTEVDCYSLYDATERGNFIDKFCGICDNGVVTYISDFVSADVDGQTIFSPTFWRACHNSNIGLFWMNFVAVVVADEQTLKYDKLVYNFRDEDTVVENLNQIWGGAQPF